MTLDTYRAILSSSKLRLTRIDRFEDTKEGRYRGSQAALKEILEQSEIVRMPDNNLFVSCWSRRPDQSMAMWDIYARHGIAIVSTTEKLKAFANQLILTNFIRGLPFREKAVLVRGAADVTYSDEPTVIRYLAKRRCFDYEMEYRIFFGLIPDPKLPTEVDVSFNVLDIVEKVVISPRANRELCDEVIDISSKYNLDARVVRSDILD